MENMDESTQPTDLSAEQKIKRAAARVFQKKGFSASRTRDIVEEAGINLALINYYFRSKRNLFDLIMEEKLADFFKNSFPLILSESLGPEEKIQQISKNYIHLLLENPDLPFFIFNAIHSDPAHFAKIVDGAGLIQQSHFARQIHQINPEVRFEQIFLNLMGLCVFPFIMRPALNYISPAIHDNFEQLMRERITLIPGWINSMIRPS